MAPPGTEGATEEQAAPAPEPESSGDQSAEGADGEPQPKPHQRLFRSKSFIPTVVVAGLIVFVLLSSRLAGRPPQIDSITPKSGKPGDVVIITGRYFGASRGSSEVRISGISPTTSEYAEWTDARISVTIPDEATSGVVYVTTRNGRSRGILFVNREQIPVLASGPAKPGEPYVSAIQPLAARVGEAITITGMNFGLEKGSSEVYFTWMAGGEPSTDGAFELANLLPAREYNLDYLSWSDREIRMRVPDGAASGNVLVTSDKGRSNSVYFEILAGAGTKQFASPRKYSAQYAMNIAVAAASGENALYLWMPRIIATPEQRKIQLVSQDPSPLLLNNGPALYSFSNMQKGAHGRISMSWMFDRYTVETQVNPAKVPLTYDSARELLRKFTAADPLVPSTAPEVVKTAATIVGSEKNPWLKARRLYDWLLSQLSYPPSARESDPIAALKQKRGDSFAYSSLLCALLRASGVPSRMVSGYIVGDLGKPVRRHFWDEFYVETLGWLPVDPLLGDERSLSPLSDTPDFDAVNYYFGNLDNRHITFSKGLEMINQMSPEGRPKRKSDLPYLLTIHEEAVGGIAAYATAFEDLEVTGTY